MSTGRFTTGLALDIGLPALVGHLNLFRVIQEIAILEGTHPGPSTTKPETPFTGQLLKGLWHKHYTQAQNMVQNVQLEMYRDGTLERVLGKYAGQQVTQGMINELVHAFVQENYLNRSQQGRLTGEWIVFANTPAGNIYLTLESHLEGDKQILDRLTVYQTIPLLEKT